MAWQITLQDHQGVDHSILLDDLSAEDFSEICAPYQGETNWLRLYQSPAAHPLAFYDLVCRCAIKMQVPSPDRPRTIRDTRALLDVLEPVDDDLPTEFSESGVPLHEAGEVATTTPSTSIEPADGLPPSLDDNH